MMDPVDDNTHYIWNAFYFNREDDRALVPKRARWFGFTFNFAHPATYLILGVILMLGFLLSQAF